MLARVGRIPRPLGCGPITIHLKNRSIARLLLSVRPRPFTPIITGTGLMHLFCTIHQVSKLSWAYLGPSLSWLAFHLRTVCATTIANRNELVLRAGIGRIHANNKLPSPRFVTNNAAQGLAVPRRRRSLRPRLRQAWLVVLEKHHRVPRGGGQF